MIPSTHGYPPKMARARNARAPRTSCRVWLTYSILSNELMGRSRINDFSVGLQGFDYRRNHERLKDIVLRFLSEAGPEAAPFEPAGPSWGLGAARPETGLPGGVQNPT